MWLKPLETIMWSSFALNNPQIGPTMGQKREFHNLPTLLSPAVNIMSNKTFGNPNFVNKQHPFVHSYSMKTLCKPSIDLHPKLPDFTKCQFDNVSSKVENQNDTLNSSQNHKIIDKIKEIHPEIIETNPVASQPIDMCGTINTIYNNKKNNRRARRRKIPSCKNNKDNRQTIIDDMMDVESYDTTDYSATNCDKTDFLPRSLNLNDFIPFNSPKKSDSMEIIELNAEIIQSPVVYGTPKAYRERNLSVCESEDSFVVFESGSEDECNFSEDDSSEDESETESDSDFDSSGSVIPNKRVRFAEPEELCEVHKMHQWAYAYQAARKGPWEEYARDRERFKNRIYNSERKLKSIFDKNHRENIFKERFMENDT